VSWSTWWCWRHGWRFRPWYTKRTPLRCQSFLDHSFNLLNIPDNGNCPYWILRHVVDLDVGTTSGSDIFDRLAALANQRAHLHTLKLNDLELGWVYAWWWLGALLNQVLQPIRNHLRPVALVIPL